MKKKEVPFLRSKEWKELRAKALIRDGHRCVLCGSEERVVVHHALYRKFYKALQNQLDGLVCVCTKCHFRIHKSAGNIALAEWLRANRPGQYQWILDHIDKKAP